MLAATKVSCSKRSSRFISLHTTQNTVTFIGILTVTATRLVLESVASVLAVHSKVVGLFCGDGVSYRAAAYDY